jgi:hypothetical protein
MVTAMRIAVGFIVFVGSIGIAVLIVSFVATVLR